jgi:uncharacterized membrane protein
MKLYVTPLLFIPRVLDLGLELCLWFDSSMGGFILLIIFVVETIGKNQVDRWDDENTLENLISQNQFFITH